MLKYLSLDFFSPSSAFFTLALITIEWLSNLWLSSSSQTCISVIYMLFPIGCLISISNLTRPQQKFVFSFPKSTLPLSFLSNYIAPPVTSCLSQESESLLILLLRLHSYPVSQFWYSSIKPITCPSSPHYLCCGTLVQNAFTSPKVITGTCVLWWKVFKQLSISIE